MKKILLFLLLMPLIYAQVENYNTVDSLEMNTVIDSRLDIEGGTVNSLEAVLKHFPRDDYRQTVLKEETEPKATIKDNQIEFKWSNVRDKVEYSFRADVSTINDLRKVNKKINFPVVILDEKIKEYTEETEFIDINSDIKNKAREIIKDENDLYFAVFKIGEWVRNNIDYNLSTLTEDVVQKSSWVLENKEGVCDEITNLFISMLRSQGIPARFIGGVAYTNQGYKFGNHGWAEVYFPEVGWVPFDITYGQYGWIDPSHIKMSENYDSGESSVEYTWKAGGAKLKTNEININVEVINKGKKINPLTRMEVVPLKKEVDFGSYMPIEVSLENLQDYYLPLSVGIIKSPRVIGENVKNVLLGPRESKKIYWLVNVDTLDRKYIYTSEIEVETNFGAKGQSEIVFSKGYNFYSKEWAENIIKDFEEKEKRSYFSDLDFKCETGEDYYYSNETAIIGCVVKNLDIKAKNVRVCLNENCKSISVEDEEKVNFNLELAGIKKISLSVEDEENIKYASVDLKIIKIPNVKVVKPEIVNVGYYERKDFVFTIFVDDYIRDVYFIVLGKEVKLEDFSGKYEVKIPLRGKDLVNGLPFKLRYSGEKGIEYFYEDNYNVDVGSITNIPWYAKLRMWFRDLI